jgi:hypothetical protein
VGRIIEGLASPSIANFKKLSYPPKSKGRA